MNINAKNQDIARKLVDREVYYCASTLIHELAQKAEHFPEYEEDLYGAFEGIPDYEEAAQEAGWKQAPDGTFFIEDENQYYLSENLNERGLLNVSVHRLDYPGQGSNGAEIWAFNGTSDEAATLDGSDDFDATNPETVEEHLKELKILPEDATLSDDEDGDFETSDADSWQELCDEESIDVDDYRPDIYEHWIVSNWLADKLEAHGHKVLKDFFGMAVWCRPTTGQAILLDGVITEICNEMEIFEGQRNSWAD